MECPARQEVVTKGQSGDAFYFILNGALDVVEPEDPKGAPLATLESGDFFGEMSIISKNRTTATVVARTPAILFKLRGDLFLDFVETNDLRESFQSLWKRRPLITSVSIFRDLDPTAKHEISLLAHPQTFAKGEPIMRQGGKSDEFYVVSSGKVKIFRVNDQGKETFSITMGPGEFFGENVAMGYTDRRNASATAVGDVGTLVLSGRELRDLAKRMPILRHKLHLVMKDRGVKVEVLEKAIQVERGETSPIAP